MSNVPLLPGINAPMDEVSVKQQKLLERTEAKKQIMGEKAAGKQRAIRVDPFLAKEAQEESRKDYLGDASVVERAAYDSKAWIPVEDQDSQLGTAGQMAADVTEGTVNFGAFLGNVLGMGSYISNMEKVSNENIAAHQAEQMYAAQQKELYAADRQVTVDLLSGKIGQIEADVARANIAKAWDSLKAPNAQQSAALDQRPKQAEIGMNPAAALTMSPSDYAEGGVLEQAKTPRERIEGAKAMLGITNKAMAAVEDSVKGIANPVHTEKVTGDLGKSFDKHKPTFDVVRNAYEAGDKDFAIREGTKAVVNMAADMGLDIVENPRGVADFVAQNLPQIVVGAAGTGGKVLMSTSNLGYGLDTYRQGLNTFVEKNGRQPTQEESTEMLAFGMAAAALDQGVDANFVKTLKGATGDAIGEVVQRNTGSKVARLVSAPITGMAEELPAEAIQSVIEKDLSHLNYAIDTKNAVIGGVIGGAAGAALKGGLEPAGQIAEGAAAAQAKMVEQNNERRLQREKSRVSKEVLDAAIQTGDVSALTDPTSDHYSPVLAANALFERTKREDLSAEDKAKQAEQAQQVVLGLEKRIEELDANKNKARPEDLANITGNITRIQEALGKVDPAQNPELHGQLTETLKAYEEERTALDVVDPETLAMREKEIQSLEALLPDVRRMADATSASVASLAQPKPEDIAKDVELVNTPAAQAGEEHKAAAKRVITLAMEGEGISSDDIDALVGNLDNSLSAEERDFLGTVRDNRFAENNFKSREDVRMDVLDGSADGQFLGINQFRKRLSASIKAGNADQAATHLQGITAFAQERAGKVKAMVAAWKDFQRTGVKTQWVRDPSSPTGFVKADREYTREELTEAKGFEIHGRSARLIKSVQEEAALAAGALKEMQAAYGLAFNAKPTQAPAVQQEQPAKPVTPAKATKPAPAPAPQSAAAPKEEASQAAPATKAAAPSPKKMKLFSGGAKGSDSFWGKTAARFGIPQDQILHYYHGDKTPEGNTPLTEGQVAEGTVKAKQAAKALGRNWSPKAFVQNLLIRNWMQVKHADAVFAVGTFDPKNPTKLSGGTAYAVEMAIQHQVPVHFFEQEKGQWFTWDGAAWQETEVPTLTQNFAGIGTRDLNDAGKQAIEAVFEKTFGQAQAANTPEAEPQANAEEGVEPTSEETQSNEAESVEDLDAELKEIFARINEEADVAESLEVVAEEPASSLSVLEDTANPIHGQVVQRKVKEDQTGGNPLAEKPNFLSHWLQNPDVSSFLPKGLVLSAKQSRLLRTLKETMAEWVPALSNVLVPPDTSEKAKAFWYLDPIQFFQKEDGSVDQNFGMAMGLAGFDLLSDLVSNSGQATESWINKALGRDEEAPVSPQLSNLVSNAGVREGYLSREAGKQVLKMLNLRFTDDAPQDLQFRLEYSVGNNVVALLEHLGLLERTVITDDRLQRAMNALGAGDPNRQHVFFRPAQANGEVREDIQELVKTLVGTEGFMDKFFGIESARVEPGFEAKPFTQKNAKGTDSPLPKDLIDRVNAHQQNAYQVRFDTFGILRGLADDIVLKMAGQEEVTVHTPEVMKEGIEGANKALARTWEADKQYLENLDANEGLDTPLFMEIFVARNHRMHYKNTVLNPQASKISRWLLGMEGWRVTIDTANEQLMENFKLRILEGFGVKTDKSVNRDTINREWTKRTHDPVIRRAVSLLASALAAQEEGQDFSFTPGEQQMLLDAVEKSGEKLHSFDSLLQLAHWQHAYNQAPVGEDGKKPASIKFSTVMAGEVDGKTNGGMLAMLGYATAGWDDLNRGGFIEKGSLYEHFSAWASENGHLDLYESFTAYIAQAMADGFEDWQIKQLQSLFAITGELTAGESVTKAGREFSKKPMTTLFYGSGKESTLDGMFDAYIEKIYDHISKISENGESNGMQLKDLIGHLNVIIKAGNSRLKKKGVPLAPLLDPKMTIGEALKLDFMPQRAAMRQGYDLMVKKPLESSLDKKFGNHLATTGLMIEASNLIFDLYRSVYEAQRKRLVQKLIAQGARVNQKGEMIHDLTRAQERELREKMARFLPVIGLASSGAKNNPDFLMVKKERVSSTDSLSPDYKVEVRRRTTGANGQKKLSKHYAEAEHYKELPPGVSSLPIGTQSKDARISSTSMAQLPVFNMHDANYFGLGDIVEGARNLNQATFETLLDYSLPTQLADTLERILQAAADTLKSKNVDTDYKTDLVRALQALLDSRQEEGEDAEIVTFGSFASMAIQLRRIEVKKLIKMAELKVVEQYPLEGAGYRITGEDQDRVISRLNEARARDLTPLEKAAAQLDKYLDRDGGEANELMPKEGRPVEGAPYTQSNPALVELLEKGTTAQGLMEFLEDHYQAAANTSRINQFNLKLIKMIRRVVPGDLPIHYITTNTETLHTDRDMSRDLAWFHQDGEGNASISVWGQDYATSNIQPQVLLHELLHAALVHVVDAAATPEVRELVAELEELRAKAAAFIKSVPNLHKHAPGVKNIHEFLAYGLTSPQFQQQVLVPLELESKTKGNLLRTAWHKFVDIMSGLLLGNSIARTRANNGLSTFLANSLPLFQAANELQQKAVESGPVTLAHAGIQEAMEMTTEQVFRGLPASPNRALSDQFQAHLSSLLNGIVSNLYGPFGSFAQRLRKEQAVSMSDVMLKSMATGQMPFASEALAGPFLVTEQEAFVLEQVEVTVHAALTSPGNFHSMAYTQLERLFEQARKKITAAQLHDGDWATATQAERDLAQKRWNFLFDVSATANNKNRFLSRFAAMALAHEPTRKLMAFDTDSSKEAVEGTWLEKLVHWFRNLLTALGNQLNHTYDGQRADARLEALVDRLVDIEAKRRRRIASPANRAMEFVESLGDSTSNKLRDAIRRAGDSDLLKNSKSAYLRAAGTTLGAWAGDRFADIAEVGLRVRDQQLQKPLGVAANLVTQLRGATDKTREFYRLLGESKHHEAQRQNKIENTRDTVLKNFLNQGADLTPEQKKAISQLLRLDLASLLDQYSETQIAQLLSDPAALNAAIQQERQQLAGAKFAQAYDVQAKDLGYFMVSGITHAENQVLNAQGIVLMLATDQKKEVEAGALTKYQGVVDRLATLYALQYSSPITLAEASSVWRSEQDNKKGNGLVSTLKVYRTLINQAKDTVFQKAEPLMIKGYLPEIHDPHREVLGALPEEEEALRRQGYTPGEILETDSLDPNPQRRRLYVHTNRGLRPFLSAVMSYTSKAAKGSERKRFGSEVDKTVIQGSRQELLAMRRAKVQTARAQLAQRSSSYDPRKSRDRSTKAVPVFNAKGEVANYRYMMTQENRDILLDRDNRFENLLGQLAGNTFDKFVAPQNNKIVVEALHAHFQEEYGNKPDSFALIAGNSKDPALREIWRMLPDETKRDIQKTWGFAGMQVPYEMLDLIFGYRKPSISQVFDKNPEEWSTLQQMVIPMLETVYPRIGNHLRVAENVWQEAVGLVKNIWVIRSFVTILGNIKSNLSMLFAYGVSPADIVRNHLVAFRGAWAYRRDFKEREQLQLALDSGLVMGSTDEIKRQIAQLSNRLATNPVRELIEAGLLPTIVEDVQTTTDEYSYQSKLEKKVSGALKYIPPIAVTVGKELLMTKDTQSYGMFNQLVQMSDFMGRYTLYQHMITKKKDPLSKQEAMDKAMDSFIQYDIPLHRNLQYLDEMGIIPFMRFHLRIQKVIFHLFREKPARMLSLVLLGKFLGTSSLITDASLFNNLGNPLDVGALNLPGAIDDITTMKMALEFLPGE